VDPPIEELQQQAIEESMSITGHSLCRAEFGGVSYWNTALMPEFRVLFILGGPGAGKGTQSDFLKEQYPCVHLSVGELLRNEQTREGSPHAQLIQECLVGGKIVPVEISIALLQRAMEEAAAEKGRTLLYLVDGFPRNFDNLEGWNRCMRGVSSVWGVLMFKCPLQVLVQRILARAETSGRSDDNLQSAQKRFRTFERETEPVVDTLRKVQELQRRQGSCMPLQVCDINADQTIERVWSDTQSIVNDILANDVWTANARLVDAIQSGDSERYRQLCAYCGKNDDIVSLEGKVEANIKISNSKIEFQTGTKAIISYDRVLDEAIAVRETRIWSHEGIQGWRCIHFYRLPLE
jgi:UMP-CMP kinase